MKDIQIVHQPSLSYLEKLGVLQWDIWEKEISEFPWYYDEQELCYFLAGEVIVTPAGGPITIMKGDFVTFPAGLSCTWQVLKPVRKHYRFG
ncbi:MAG: cupin domain-containing protein [Verrucomicrobiota bacterium]